MNLAICSTVVVLEREDDVAQSLQALLVAAGFGVELCSCGKRGLDLIRETGPVVVVLSRDLESLDGITVCRQLRQFSDVPVLMLGSRATGIEKALGLEVGADDYMDRDYDPFELTARVRALHRRSRGSVMSTSLDSGKKENSFQAGPFLVDVLSHQVSSEQGLVPLTFTEFSLFVALARQQGRVLGRQSIAEEIWGANHFRDERTVDVHVRHLRKKLADYGGQDFISAVRGVGYRFGVSGAACSAGM